MGDSEITIARNYQVGANGRLWMDTLPFTGEYTTYALQESNPSAIDYVTDSAASGTGWATGFKTSNGRISSVAGTGNAVTRLTTILELAQRRGFQDGQREHRGNHRCHAGRPECSHQRSWMSGSRGYDQLCALPGRRTADPGRSPSSRSIITSTSSSAAAGAIPAGDHRRTACGEDRDRVGSTARLQRGARCGHSGRHSRPIACWACSTPATCRSSGADCKRRRFLAAASRRADL